MENLTTKPPSNKLEIPKGVMLKMLDKIKSILTVRDIFYIAVGMSIALFTCYMIYHWRMDEAILLKGLVYKAKAYDVVPRP